MPDLGTATVKVLPDLTEFQQIMATLPAVGLTIREEVEFVHDEMGQVVRTIKTTSVVKGV